MQAAVPLKPINMLESVMQNVLGGLASFSAGFGEGLVPETLQIEAIESLSAEEAERCFGRVAQPELRKAA